MILTDTSIWIDFIVAGLPIEEKKFRDLVVCGPIVEEVLQGMRPGALIEDFRNRFLALPVVSDPVPMDLFLSAAEIYRQGRRRGLTIHSSMDCLIAAIAIENSIPVWHRDRDFNTIAKYTPLEVRTLRLM
jgi:predicted nucleic acid-binding protein